MPAAPERLRFFLRGQPQLVYPLYELLLNDVIAVAFAEGANDPNPIVLEASAFSPGGFGENEGLLPYNKGSHLGFRILTEYFAFPEKFLFVDLAFPQRALLAGKCGTLDVFVYLKRPSPNLERAVTAAAFALGCTPIVNLFPQTAEPIAVDHTTSEYRIVPDSRRPRALEVYSTVAVTASDGDGNRREVLPFYSVEHSLEDRRGRQGTEQPTWLLTSRRPSDPDNPGSEVYLSIVDPDFTPSAQPDHVLSVEDAFASIAIGRSACPPGGGQPALRLVNPVPLVKTMRLLTAPTSTLRPDYSQGTRWRLISHLSLNHLSLVSDGGVEALKEMLILMISAARRKPGRWSTACSPWRPGQARRVSRAGARPHSAAASMTVTFDERQFFGQWSVYDGQRSRAVPRPLRQRQFILTPYGPGEGSQWSSQDMASTRRRPNSSLKSDIFERPQAYDFFQAVQIIEAMAAEGAAAAGSQPARYRWPGRRPEKCVDQHSCRRAARLCGGRGQRSRRPRGCPVEMTQTVVGLTGPSGVLPHAFSEMVQISVRERNPGLREFFDLFNNRLAGLLYDAWAKYRIAVESERADRLDTARPIDAALRALVGIGMQPLSGRTESPDATFSSSAACSVARGGLRQPSNRCCAECWDLRCGSNSSMANGYRSMQPTDRGFRGASIRTAPIASLAKIPSSARARSTSNPR